MKYLHNYKKYSYIKEDISNNENIQLLYDLFDIMSEFIDDGFNIEFRSAHGVVNVSDFMDKNETKLNEFKPIYIAGNKIKSEFNILINKKCDYNEFSNIVVDMVTAVNRISDMGWSMNKFDFSDTNSGEFILISYNFTRPDKKTDGEIPTKDEIINVFNFFGLKVDEIEYIDNIVYVYAESFSYDGEIPNDIDDKLDRMIKKFGFNKYEYRLKYGNTYLIVKFFID